MLFPVLITRDYALATAPEVMYHSQHNEKVRYNLELSIQFSIVLYYLSSAVMGQKAEYNLDRLPVCHRVNT